MRGKRSRGRRSRSITNIGVLKKRLAPEPSRDPGRATVEMTQVQSGNQRTLTLTWPPMPLSALPPPLLEVVADETECGGGRGDEGEYFLERCYYCKKSLPHNENIYMYGDFGAFCSPECRLAQMEITR